MIDIIHIRLNFVKLVISSFKAYSLESLMSASPPDNSSTISFLEYTLEENQVLSLFDSSSI